MKNSVLKRISILFAVVITVTFASINITCASQPGNFGDVDTNAYVEAGDALLVLKYAARLQNFSNEQEIVADVDGSKVVDSSDALLILKHASKLIDYFPVENSESDLPIVIEVNWDGDATGGGLMFLAMRLEGVDSNDKAITLTSNNGKYYDSDNELLAEVVKKEDSDKGNVIFTLYKTDIDVDFEITADIEWMQHHFANGISRSNVSAEVTLSNGKKYYYDLSSGVYRSYTGVYLWGPFGIEDGKLTEYDSTWIDEGYDSMLNR